jgi:hypothetical protein
MDKPEISYEQGQDTLSDEQYGKAREYAKYLYDQSSELKKIMNDFKTEGESFFNSLSETDRLGILLDVVDEEDIEINISKVTTIPNKDGTSTVIEEKL